MRKSFSVNPATTENMDNFHYKCNSEHGNAALVMATIPASQDWQSVLLYPQFEQRISFLLLKCYIRKKSTI